jgi:hypothetical protein
MPPHTAGAFHHFIDPPNHHDRQQDHREKRLASDIRGRDLALPTLIKVDDLGLFTGGGQIAPE